MVHLHRHGLGRVVDEHLRDPDRGLGGIGRQRHERGPVLTHAHLLVHLELDAARDARAVVPAAVGDVGVLNPHADDHVVAVRVGEDFGEIE